MDERNHITHLLMKNEILFCETGEDIFSTCLLAIVMKKLQSTTEHKIFNH